ncbi:MAG: RnfABCDGE type electron transport complex subunit G [Bacteroidales bacterium]
MAKESNLKNMVLSLLVITLVSSATLGFMYNLTKGPRADAEANKLQLAVKKVLPAYTNNPVAEKYTLPNPDGEGAELVCYPALNNDKPVGVAIETWTMNGFSGLIRLMVGFSQEGEIVEVVVLEQKETPGLGTKMGDPSFKDQFKGLIPGGEKFKVKKDGGDIDAITAATISSRAFIDALNRANRAYMGTEGNSGATAPAK